MALQSFANGLGRLLTPLPESTDGTLATSLVTLDAAGESLTGIGRIVLTSGPGTSKTLSSAGGKVFVRLNSVTLSNAASNVRIGVQDVGATGIEDGTFDAYADFVGGAGGLTASAVNQLAITTGSKTITHGDLVAISVEMTARGGADSVQVARVNTSSTIPYTTVDSGAGPAKQNVPPMFAILFDDGTLGYLAYAPMFIESVTAFGSTSTPDEVALVFRVPFKAAVWGFHAKLAFLAATDDFEFILYSDPLGTPVAERTITKDMDLSGLGASWDYPLTSPFTIEPNTYYAIALRPTTTNTLGYHRISFGSGNSVLALATALGNNWYYAARTDQTGAFGSSDLTQMPQFGVYLGQFEDGAGGGGGGNTYSRGRIVNA